MAIQSFTTVSYHTTVSHQPVATVHQPLNLLSTGKYSFERALTTPQPYGPQPALNCSPPYLAYAFGSPFRGSEMGNVTASPWQVRWIWTEILSSFPAHIQSHYEASHDRIEQRFIKILQNIQGQILLTL